MPNATGLSQYFTLNWLIYKRGSNRSELLSELENSLNF